MFFMACESAADKIAREAAEAQKSGSKTTSSGPNGMAVFRNNCVICHGADGKMGMNGAKDLSASTLTAEERISIITNGKNLMTPFKALLSEAEIKAVAEYTQTLKAAE